MTEPKIVIDELKIIYATFAVSYSVILAFLFNQIYCSNMSNTVYHSRHSHIAV